MNEGCKSPSKCINGKKMNSFFGLSRSLHYYSGLSRVLVLRLNHTHTHTLAHLCMFFYVALQLGSSAAQIPTDVWLLLLAPCSCFENSTTAPPPRDSETHSERDRDRDRDWEKESGSELRRRALLFERTQSERERRRKGRSTESKVKYIACNIGSYGLVERSAQTPLSLSSLECIALRWTNALSLSLGSCRAMPSRHAMPMDGWWLSIHPSSLFLGAPSIYICGA